MKNLLKGFCAVALLSASMAVTAITAVASPTPLPAMGMGFARPTGPDAGAVGTSQPLPDPRKELHQLSRNLKLKKDQRTVVASILEERAREIRLLFDVESLSQEYRTTLAARVVQDSNAQIETFLRNKQKRKFDKVLAKDPITL